MDSSTPGFPVHYQLMKPAQTQVHWVSDAIQPSLPLSSPSPPALNLSQRQGLLKWVSSSCQLAKVLEFQLQHQSFKWIFRTDSFVCVCVSHSVVLNSLQTHGLQPTRLLCPWDFPGKDTGVGLPFPSPGDLPNPGIEAGSPALQADSLLTELQGKPKESPKTCWFLTESYVI